MLRIMYKKQLLLGLVVMLMLMLTGCGTGEGSGSRNKYIDVVKKASVYEENPDVTIGDLFENYFTDGEWTYANLSEESSKGIEHSVEFSGKCHVENELTTVKIWFVVEDVESGSFYLNGGYCPNEKYTAEDIVMAVIQNVDVQEIAQQSADTWEEYINSCQKVTIEDIARNPESYIGKNIIVYGSLGETMGVLSIGLWTSVYPMTVEYDDVAYDTNLNPLGNILDTDYGYVIGQMIDDSTIKAEIVIVSDSDNLFSDGNNPFAESETSEGSGLNYDLDTDTENVTEETGFIGLQGDYICTNADNGSWTGRIQILEINETELVFQVSSLDYDGPQNLLTATAYLEDESTAIYDDGYGFSMTLSWIDSENFWVGYIGELTGTDSGTLMDFLNNRYYYREPEFN